MLLVLGVCDKDGLLQNAAFESRDATAAPNIALRAGASKDEFMEYIHSQLDSLRGVAVLGGLMLAKGRTSSSRLEGGAPLQCAESEYEIFYEA